MTRHSIWFLFDNMRCDFIWLAVLFVVCASPDWFVPELVPRPLRRLKNRSILFFFSSLLLFHLNSFFSLSKTMREMRMMALSLRKNELPLVSCRSLLPHPSVVLVLKLFRLFVLLFLIRIAIISQSAVNVNYSLQINDNKLHNEKKILRIFILSFVKLRRHNILINMKWNEKKTKQFNPLIAHVFDFCFTLIVHAINYSYSNKNTQQPNWS